MIINLQQIQSKFLLLIFLLATIATSTVTATVTVATNEKNHVIKLTDQNFEDLTNDLLATKTNTNTWFINFHSPSCGHCSTLAPIWSSFAQDVHLYVKEKSDDPNADFVSVGSIDVKANPKLADRFSITKLPTLILFTNNEMYVYPPSNEREVDKFIQFIYREEYKEVDRQVIPEGPVGLLKIVGKLRKGVYDIELLRFLLDDVEHIISLRKNAAILLIGLGMVIGIFLISFLNLFKRAFAAGHSGSNGSSGNRKDKGVKND